MNKLQNFKAVVYRNRGAILGAVIAAPFMANATTATVASVTTSMVTSLTQALSDIITNVMPLLALGFGIAASVRWGRKAISSSAS